MRVRELRPGTILQAMIEAIGASVAQPGPDYLIARWREAMARERGARCATAFELIPARVTVSRSRR
jgi:hypothetical protein